MIVDITERAFDELDAAISYLRLQSPRAAERVGEAIMQMIRSLSDSPHRGRHGRIAGTREVVVSGASYVVVYSVQADSVLVLSVRHTARGATS